MLKIAFAFTLASLALGAQTAEARCADRAEQKQIGALNTKLIKLKKSIPSEKSKCDKMETKGLAKCEKECGKNTNCTVMQCKAEQKWYNGGRIGCYVDTNKKLEPEIAALKKEMKPLIEKGCMPLDNGEAYKSNAPSSIDMNAKNEG